MAAAGQTQVVRAEDVAFMGITEVVRHMPHVYRQYRRLVAHLKQQRPDIAILIDFPDVNFRLAKHCKRLGIPVLWFVSPQLWAWKRRRLRWVQQRVDKMLVIFPFEAEFYRNRGVNADFVGHPLATLPLPTISREAYADAAGAIHQEQWSVAESVLQSTPLADWAFYKSVLGIRYPLDPAKPWIALLPGSRQSEIFANLLDLVETAVLLGSSYEYLLPIAATVSDETLTSMQVTVGEELVGPNPPRITFVRDTRAALFHARAAVIASGTATVQALTIGTPFLVVYRVSRLTFFLAKRLIRYPPEVWPPAELTTENGQRTTPANLPIAMVNLIAGRRIVPEFLNERFTAANLAAALLPLLDDTPQRARMVADLAEARQRLLPPTGRGDPIERVCDAVAQLLATKPAR
jgi:lipid-A-disaccharide synthase